MKQELSKHLADGATTLAVSTGATSSVLGYINHYAAGIGVLCTIFFGLIGSFFYYITWKKSTLADQNKADIESLSIAFSDHKQETREEFKKVSSGIDEILEIVANGK